jgi:hypothetical protein
LGEPELWNRILGFIYALEPLHQNWNRSNLFVLEPRNRRRFFINIIKKKPSAELWFKPAPTTATTTDQKINKKCFHEVPKK